MKFKHNIEAQAGFKDKDGHLGSAGQVLSSTGTQTDWIDQSTINAGSADHIVIYAKNTSGASISKGTPVYITGTVGATDIVEIAPANASDSAKMPAVGLANETILNNGFGSVTTGGFLSGITTDPIDSITPSSNDTVYVKAGGGLTLTKPTEAALIQNVAKVGKVSGGNSGSLIVSSILRTNDVPAPMYVDHANQRVGIRRTSPDGVLDIRTDSLYVNTGITVPETDDQDPAIIFYRDAGYANLAYPWWFQATGTAFSIRSGNAAQRGSESVSTKILINNSGSVGIGTTSPGQKLHVNGDMTASNYYLNNDNTRGMAAFLGDPRLICNSAVYVTDSTFDNYKPIRASAFTVSSDYRLKSNIIPLDNAIARLNQLEVYRFNWNNRLDELKVDGFIAHEVASVIPEAVLGEKDATFEDGTPDYQGIDQSKIVPLLTAALKEAIEKIESLETRITQLENN